MFSIMITASSITKPTAIVSAINEILSRLKPRKYVATRVAAIAPGMVMLGMRVVQNRRRNSASTSTTSTMAVAIVSWTSTIAARISKRAVINDVEINRRRYPLFLTCGIVLTISSTVSTTLASGFLST